MASQQDILHGIDPVVPPFLKKKSIKNKHCFSPVIVVVPVDMNPVVSLSVVDAVLVGAMVVACVVNPCVMVVAEVIALVCPVEVMRPVVSPED